MFIWNAELPAAGCEQMLKRELAARGLGPRSASRSGESFRRSDLC